MTGQVHLLRTIVPGEVLLVITSPPMSLLCKFHPLFIFWVFGLIFSRKCSNLFCVCLSLYMLSSNLSDLNLDGEISPAIGDLKSLLSM